MAAAAASNRPADAVAGNRQGDHGADHGDRADRAGERERFGEDGGPCLVIGKGNGRSGHRDQDRGADRDRGEAAADQRRRRGIHRLMVHHVCISSQSHWSCSAVRQAATRYRRRSASTTITPISPASDRTA